MSTKYFAISFVTLQRVSPNIQVSALPSIRSDCTRGSEPHQPMQNRNLMKTVRPAYQSQGKKTFADWIFIWYDSISCSFTLENCGNGEIFGRKFAKFLLNTAYVGLKKKNLIHLFLCCLSAPLSNWYYFPLCALFYRCYQKLNFQNLHV